MSHFTRTRPAGFWTFDSTVLDTEFEDLDQKTSKAINGDDGGAWAPTSQIVIGGSGLRISAASGFVVDNTISATEIDGDHGGVDGDWHVGGALDVDGGMAVTAGTCAVQALTCTTLHATGTITASNDINVAGNLNAQSSCALQGLTTVTGRVFLNNHGHITYRSGPNITGTASVGINDGDIFLTTVASGSIFLTLNSIGASQGDVIEVAYSSGAGTVVIKNTAGATLVTTMATGSGNTQWARFMWLADWILIASTKQ